MRQTADGFRIRRQHSILLNDKIDSVFRLLSRLRGMKMGHSVALNFADGKTFFISVNNDELLLDAAVRQGINLPLDCREGVCGTCQGQCETGIYEQEYVDEDALSERDLAERKMLACQTRVKSDAAFYFDHDSAICNAGDTLKIETKVTAVELGF